MDRRNPVWPLLGKSSGPYWFVLRVVAMSAVLAVPILATSYTQVSSVSADIRIATVERDEAATLARVIALFDAVEAVRRDLGSTGRARAQHDRTAANIAFAAADRAYAGPDTFAGTTTALQRAGRAWQRAQRRTDIDSLADVLRAVQQIASELDDDLPLENDPNSAVQYLIASTLQNSPRAIVAVRRTADAARRARGPRLDARSIEQLATARALQGQPSERLFADVTGAIALEPELGAPLRPLLAQVERGTRGFDDRVDRMLRTFVLDRTAAGTIDGMAVSSIDAQLTLMRANRAQAARLIQRRRNELILRRRIIIVISSLAILLGTLAIVVVGRYMARRDRIELMSAKLESDKLRAELHAMSSERALRLQEAQFRSVFENADLGIVIFELDGSLAQYNSAVCDTLGDRIQTILAGRLAQIAEFRTAREPFTLEEMHPRDDGTAQWLALTFSGVYDKGECQMVVALIRDTTEEKLLQQGLFHAANHDGLTQIANRSAFERELRTLIAEAHEPFALVYIDLDKFKPVNDRFGHAAGDHVLVTTADRIRSSLASTDLCARLGGDEFAAIVRGRNDRARMASIAKRIGTSIAAPIRFGEQTLTVTASIGVAIRSDRTRTGDELKIDADRALYAVKDRGGNGQRVAVSDQNPLLAETA